MTGCDIEDWLVLLSDRAGDTTGFSPTSFYILQTITVCKPLQTFDIINKIEFYQFRYFALT